MDERIIPPGNRFYVRKIYRVKDRSIKPMHLKQNSYVTDIISIAAGEGIKDIKRLIATYPIESGNYTKAQDWCKMRGTAIVSDGEAEFKAEVHWYE